MRKTIILLCLLPMSALLFCAQPDTFENPSGYNFSKPKKYILKNALHEISGIIFLNNATYEIGAIEDEDGKFYYFRLDDDEYKQTKFGKKGDYEDVALMNNKDIIVLRSDGSLFSFPLTQVGNKDVAGTRIYENILPAGEYEGMYADGDNLYVLCKNCPDDNQRKEISMYVLQLDNTASLHITRQFKIDLSTLHLKKDNPRPKFHPSCFAKHPVTHEWYVISSVNKLLIILDDQWKIKRHYALDPFLFKQPEGIVFDDKGNLYISNEGGEGKANILQFDYNQSR
ncbi:MAG: SdiA-regulated family protein [Bacteroidetes bacterium]|nr:SdiA-regulated family protein [Bacteroidota bacterium]